MQGIHGDVGDIIFIYTPSAGALVSVVGQSALRMGDVIKRRQASRFSHVMMSLAPGLVIHSDGKSVKIETFKKAIKTADANGRLSVRRHPTPMTQAEQAALVANAERYINQNYSFLKISRKLGFPGRETKPFCSELIAAAYAAIDRPITNAPPRDVLPIDLEEACSQWPDVTALYNSAPEPLGMPQLANEIARMDEEVERALQHGVKTLAAKHTLMVQFIGARQVIAGISARDVAVARKFATLSGPIAADTWADFARSNCLQLPRFYEELLEGMVLPFADTVDELFAPIHSEVSFYETLPTAREIRRREQQAAYDKLLGPALRIGMSLCAVAASRGLSLPALPIPSFEPNALVADEIVETLPSMDKRFAGHLRQTIRGLTIPEDVQDGGQLRAFSNAIVNLHYALARV